MKKSKWITKPKKKGWYWARTKGAAEVFGAGFIQCFDRTWFFDCGWNRRALQLMWNFEFHPVTPPK